MIMIFDEGPMCEVELGEGFLAASFPHPNIMKHDHSIMFG
jgi:hypothetical protein